MQDAKPSDLPEEGRQNVRGLSVEYVRRDPVSGAWGDKGLLDFNMLHGENWMRVFLGG